MHTNYPLQHNIDKMASYIDPEIGDLEEMLIKAEEVENEGIVIFIIISSSY